MKGVILKIDIEKAFDSVRWDSIQKVLTFQGLGKRWIMWVTSIISTVRLSVLVNGSLTKEFNRGRGLRQGDPISPLIFIQVSNILNLLMEKDCALGIVKGISLGENLVISHLQYADDTIFFFEIQTNKFRGLR